MLVNQTIQELTMSEKSLSISSRACCGSAIECQELKILHRTHFQLKPAPWQFIWWHLFWNSKDFSQQGMQEDRGNQELFPFGPLR